MSLDDLIVATTSDADIKKVVRRLAAGGRKALRAAAVGATPRQLFEAVLPTLYKSSPSLRSRISDGYGDGSIRWILNGESGGAWTLSFRGGALVVHRDSESAVTVTLATATADFRALVRGALDPQTAISTKKLRISGDLGFVLNHPCATPI